jgi:hypothetical protein
MSTSDVLKAKNNAVLPHHAKVRLTQLFRAG